MIYLALWLVTALAIIAWLTASTRAHRAREAGLMLGFAAGLEAARQAMTEAGHDVGPTAIDPEHYIAQVRAAKEGRQ